MSCSHGSRKGRRCVWTAPRPRCEVADAEQAYIQAELKSDIPTWVELPRERWPESWKNMRRPVCRLKLALYGHPDSGGHWERHCEQQLLARGFVRVRDWRSVYWHSGLAALLVVYVDDLSSPVRQKICPRPGAPSEKG